MPSSEAEWHDSGTPMSISAHPTACLSTFPAKTKESDDDGRALDWLKPAILGNTSSSKLIRLMHWSK